MTHILLSHSITKASAVSALYFKTETAEKKGREINPSVGLISEELKTLGKKGNLGICSHEATSFPAYLIFSFAPGGPYKHALVEHKRYSLRIVVRSKFV